MLKQSMSTNQIHFWNEQNHGKQLNYSIESARRESQGQGLTDDKRQRMEAHKKEVEAKTKKENLLGALSLVSNIPEIIDILGNDISPLALVALGNMAEQAKSTLKLLGK
jgi:hypothetical protein